MRTRSILMLASVAMILIVAGTGNAFANSFGGQQEISSCGTVAASWRATITNSGNAEYGWVSWDNEWYNWNTVTVTPELNYWYKGRHYPYDGPTVQPNNAWPETEFTSVSSNSDIVGINHVYWMPDYSSFTVSPSKSLHIN